MEPGFKTLGQLPGPAAAALSLSIGINLPNVVQEEVVLTGASHSVPGPPSRCPSPLLNHMLSQIIEWTLLEPNTGEHCLENTKVLAGHVSLIPHVGDGS